jgi:hypothetical protein
MYLIGVDVGDIFTDIVFADAETGRTLIGQRPRYSRRQPALSVISAARLRASSAPSTPAGLPFPGSGR